MALRYFGFVDGHVQFCEDMLQVVRSRSDVTPTSQLMLWKSTLEEECDALHYLLKKAKNAHNTLKKGYND